MFPSRLDMIIQWMSGIKRINCSCCCSAELPSLRAGRGGSEAPRVEMFVTLGWYLRDEGGEHNPLGVDSLHRSSAPCINNRTRGQRRQQRGITFQKHWQLLVAWEGTAHPQMYQNYPQLTLASVLSEPSTDPGRVCMFQQLALSHTARKNKSEGFVPSLSLT